MGPEGGPSRSSLPGRASPPGEMGRPSHGSSLARRLHACGQNPQVTGPQGSGGVPMTKVLVDGRSVEVPEAPTILDAPQAAGAYVPTLCDHPQLRPLGSCRMCQVQVKGSPRLALACCGRGQEGVGGKTTAGGA